jgi:hypothetical protein
MTLTRDRRWVASLSTVTGPASRLVVNVLSTSEQETSAALEAAAALARGPDAGVRIVAFHIVPYPLDLNHPNVAPSFTMAGWTALARTLSVKAHFQICYGRDVAAAIEEALEPRSLIVVGRRKNRWWSVRDSRLTRLLRSRYHDLVVVEVR